MATLAESKLAPLRSDDRFFLNAAFCMAAVIAVGFSLQVSMGRATFSSSLIVHAHAIVFMGWVVLFVLQNFFAVTGRALFHRRLGWLATVWMVAMLVLGCVVTVAMARRGQVPYFFRPQHFLIFDPMSLFSFAGLTTAAIVLRRRTDWHRRLHYCGMCMLLGPGFGRMLPMPLLPPLAWEATFAASMIFPIVGVTSDYRRSGAVHPAWTLGIGVMLSSFLMIEGITYSPVGDAIYSAVTAGSPGATVPPLSFPTPPVGPLVTGRS